MSIRPWAVGTLLMASGCRCGNASDSNEQPPSDLTASTRAMTESSAESSLAFPVTSAITQSTTDASSPEAAELAPGGSGLRIVARGVDNYEILGDRSFSLGDELYVKERVIRPAYDNDKKVVGLELFGVRKGSLPEQLGLMNGDVIRRINKVRLDNPENAALVLGYRYRSRVTLDVVRAGTQRTLTYEVR